MPFPCKACCAAHEYPSCRRRRQRCNSGIPRTRSQAVPRTPSTILCGICTTSGALHRTSYRVGLAAQKGCGIFVGWLGRRSGGAALRFLCSYRAAAAGVARAMPGSRRALPVPAPREPAERNSAEERAQRHAAEQARRVQAKTQQAVPVPAPREALRRWAADRASRAAQSCRPTTCSTRPSLHCPRTAAALPS